MDKLNKYQMRSPLTNEIIVFDKIEIIDEIIHEWKTKISDLKFSVEQMEMYKKELKGEMENS